MVLPPLLAGAVQVRTMSVPLVDTARACGAEAIERAINGVDVGLDVLLFDESVALTIAV